MSTKLGAIQADISTQPSNFWFALYVPSQQTLLAIEPQT